MSQINYCYSANEEDFRHDDFGSFMDEFDLEVGSTYWRGEAIPINHSDQISVDSLLENMDDRLYEEVGDVAESEYSDVSNEAKVELVELLTAWADKHVMLRYWKVRNVTEHKVTAEDLE